MKRFKKAETIKDVKPAGAAQQHRSRKLSSQVPLTVAAFASVPFLALTSDAIAQGVTGKTTSASDSGRVDSTVTQPSKMVTKMLKNYDGQFSIEGMTDGHVIFESEKGEYFYIDPVTGDKKVLTGKALAVALGDSSSTAMMATAKKATAKKKAAVTQTDHYAKGGSSSTVRIIGMDAIWDVIMEDSYHEMFYLDPKSGDMVFVK